MRFPKPTIRNLALYALGVVLTMVVIGPIGEFFIELARERGLYDQPSRRVASVTGWVASVVASYPFGVLAGLIVGFAAGVWVDALRRRKAEPGRGHLAQGSTPAPSPHQPSNNTFIGEPPEALTRGSGNTVVNAADAAGNVIWNRGGDAIGAGAQAGPSGTAIGAGAMGRIAPGAPRSIREMTGEQLRAYALDLAQKMRAMGERQLHEEVHARPILPQISGDPLISALERIRTKYRQEFGQRFGVRARELIRELRERTGATTADSYTPIIDSNSMAGASPIVDAADVIERLAADIY